jgi:hypothetical protein
MTCNDDVHYDASGNSIILMNLRQGLGLCRNNQENAMHLSDKVNPAKAFLISQECSAYNTFINHNVALQ